MFSFLRRTVIEKSHQLTRREFIDLFASNGGYDQDSITEFILEMESVNGISVNMCTDELHIDYYLNGTAPVTILYFSISGVAESSLYMMPSRLQKTLETECHFPVEAAGFLDFFRAYATNYSERNDKMYTDVSKVLDYQYEFSKALAALVNDLS